MKALFVGLGLAVLVGGTTFYILSIDHEHIEQLRVEHEWSYTCSQRPWLDTSRGC